MQRIHKFLATITVIFSFLAVDAAYSATKYALVIGTNYKGSPVSDLELAERDAKLMKKQIMKTGNFKSRNVKVFLGRKVNRKNIKNALLNWLGKKVRQGDQVFFYFAGHGTFVRDEKAKNGMRNVLVMYARPHITDDELNEWLKKIKTKKAVFIFDCCFSGGIAKKGAKVRGNKNIPIPKGNDSVVLQDIDDVYFKDKVVIASADDNQTAIEMGPPIRQGVFTYYFSKAMLEADLNKDKKVTAYEAFFKARNDTVKLAKKARHKQVPQISGNASGFIFKGKSGGTTTNDNTLPDIPGIDDEKEDEQDPPINDDEPVNDNNKLTGTLVLDTTYRYDLTKGRGPDIYLGDKQVSGRVKWVRSRSWGKVAYITLRRIPTGVHNVTLRHQRYPVQIIKTGIERGKPTVERVVVSKKGRGSISGHVWVGNFSQPFANLKIFLSPIRIPKQPMVKSRKDGSFAFRELLPGKYKVMVRGGLKYFTRPYDAYVDVGKDKVTKVEIVLKEFFKRGKRKR